MAAVNFTAGKFLSLKDDGSINAGGTVEFFEPDGAYSTYKTTYSNSALTTPNSNTITLDSAGRAQVYFSGDADERVKDSAAVTIYSQRNVNPVTLTSVFPLSSATDIVSTYDSSIIEVSGTTTLTLDTASVLGEGWKVTIRNVGAGVVTIARTTGGDSINGTAANITIAAGDAGNIHVNDGATGFNTVGFPLSLAQTYTAVNNFTPLQFFAAGIGPGYIQNYSLAGTVASSALTITLSGHDGTALSSTNKSQFTFRSATAATGTTSTLSVTANPTLVISSGSTLGATSAVPFRLWILGINDGGTFRLGAKLCSTATNIYSLSDDSIVSSTAEGGAGAADTAGVIYTGTAVTTKAMRVLGYMEFSLTTAGTWDEVPDKVQLWQPSMSLPGHTVQTVIASDSAVATGTTALPLDDTIPQNTEGDQFISAAITPTSAINKIKIVSDIHISNSTVSRMTACLFQDTTAGALTCGIAHAAATYAITVPVKHIMNAGTTSATTFKIRSGAESGGTHSFNGSAGARRYGGVLYSLIHIEEIMV